MVTTYFIPCRSIQRKGANSEVRDRFRFQGFRFQGCPESSALHELERGIGTVPRSASLLAHNDSAVGSHRADFRSAGSERRRETALPAGMNQYGKIDFDAAVNRARFELG